MKIPNAERAIVEVDKLTEYCLNPVHPRGRHKARVFESALGITASDADTLRDALRDAVLSDDALMGEGDEYGQRYVVEFELTGPAGDATVRSAWIVRAGGRVAGPKSSWPRLNASTHLPITSHHAASEWMVVELMWLCPRIDGATQSLTPRHPAEETAGFDQLIERAGKCCLRQVVMHGFLFAAGDAGFCG